MRVVVTGGAGFIGANLVARLATVDQVDQVVIVDDLSTGSTSNLDWLRGRGASFDFVHGSILDTQLLADACDGADTIVHLGARPSVPRSLQDPVASHLANATGTVHVLEAARHAGSAVIVASSSSVYGSNPQMPKREDMATRPLSPYAASKLATESYTNAYANSFGMTTLALRFFNVFGPLQAAGHAYAAVVPAFVDAALAKRPLTVHGDGRQSRDFTFVGTVVQVLADAVVRQVGHPSPVNLAFGTRTDLLALIAELERQLGYPLERTHTPSRVGDVAHSQADNSVLTELFPDITPVSLADGLAATIDWFRSESGRS